MLTTARASCLLLELLLSFISSIFVILLVGRPASLKAVCIPVIAKDSLWGMQSMANEGGINATFCKNSWTTWYYY